MQRLTEPASVRPVDLAVLEPERLLGAEANWRVPGESPFWEPGTEIAWRYGRRLDPMRVVLDDERGLVAWLAEGTEMVSSRRVGGAQVRDVPLAERFTGDRVPTIGFWTGPGILRIAPTARPWSIWVFGEDDGSFAGHYVNLELEHRRRGHETATRDLTLDLWLEPSGELWLKDADEVEAATMAGRYTPAIADEIHAIAEWARVDLIQARAWPLDDEWTTWRPPAEWEVPTLPDTPLVAEARRTTLPG